MTEASDKLNPVTVSTPSGGSARCLDCNHRRVVSHPSFDADGYPTEETELAIKAWDFRDAPGWLEYIREAWNHHHGRMWQENGMLKMATGGWSGNESITHAMRENYVLWSLLWESSHRGGLEVLRMPNAGTERRTATGAAREPDAEAQAKDALGRPLR